jgi:ferrous iron transport protein A
MFTMKTLDDIEEGKKARVLLILGGMGVRQHLSSIGIHVGDTVLVKRHAVWGGPVLIEVHGSEVALGRGFASKIQVEEV